MSKRKFLILNIIIFLIEVLVIYYLMKVYLVNDFISPNDVSIYEFLKFKLFS